MTGKEVIDWIELDRVAPNIRNQWRPYATSGCLPAIPNTTHDLAVELNRISQLQSKAAKGLPKLASKIKDFESLFPYGMNARKLFSSLEFARLAKAIRANLKNTPIVNNLETTISELASRGDQPFFRNCKKLLQLLYSEHVGADEVMAKRKELTHELARIRELQPQLDQFGVDLNLLEQHGVPEFAKTIRDYCIVGSSVDQTELEGVNWQQNWLAAWEWATATRQLTMCSSLVTVTNGVTAK